MNNTRTAREERIINELRRVFAGCTEREEWVLVTLKMHLNRVLVKQMQSAGTQSSTLMPVYSLAAWMTRNCLINGMVIAIVYFVKELLFFELTRLQF